MIGKEKATAPVSSVGADGKQPLTKNHNKSIADLPQKGNLQATESCPVESEKMQNKDELQTVSMTELYDTVYPPKIPIVDGLIYAGTYLFVGAPNIQNNRVIQGFAEDIAQNITADLCYIDPPYIKRQYAANYHILETIARGDYPVAKGKSGLRDWWDQHSKFCTKTKGLQSFEKVISDMNCNNFIVSYSEDGLFSLEILVELMEKYGEVNVEYIDYNRFRSNQSQLPLKLSEYMIELRKRE